MCNVENYPFNDSKIQTSVEKESQLLDSKATRFTVPGKTLKTIPWKEFDDDSSDELESIDEPPPQQSQPVNMLDSNLQELLHSELEAIPEAQSLPKFDAQLIKHLQTQFSKDLDEEGIENQMAGGKRLRQDLLDREQNFYDRGEWDISEDDLFLAEFEGLYKSLEVDVPTLSKDSGLLLIYSRTYNFLVNLDFAFSIFAKNTPLYKTIFDVCMFMGLSMFLHNTKRLRGTPFSQYIYAHSCIGFSNKKSTSYIEHKGAWKQGERTEALDSHEKTMRQFRHRLFKSRPVDNRRPEWSAIPKSSEYEWQLYFDYVDADGKADPQLRDTLKRIKNLYTGVNNAIHSPKDDGYGKRLEDALSAFQSKLHKIKYGNYLDLCKALLEHLEKEREDAKENQLSFGSTNYGINLYRFEKELCLFELTNNVRRLIECDGDQEKVETLVESLAVRDICFPHVRDKFCRYRSLDDINFFTRQFALFTASFIWLSRLLVDKLIEDGHLDENWEALFWEEIDRRVTRVLYAPADIDYSVKPGSQEAFEMLLTVQVKAVLKSHIADLHYSSEQKNTEK